MFIETKQSKNLNELNLFSFILKTNLCLENTYKYFQDLFFNVRWIYCQELYRWIPQQIFSLLQEQQVWVGLDSQRYRLTYCPIKKEWDISMFIFKHIVNQEGMRYINVYL